MKSQFSFRFANLLMTKVNFGSYRKFGTAGLGLDGSGDRTVGGKCQRHAGAARRTALDGDRAAMPLDELLDQRQAEAGALMLSGKLAVDLLERLEDALEVAGSDSDTGIDNLDQNPAVRLGGDGDADRPVRRREF